MKTREPKPTPRGLEVLRVLWVAWMNRDRGAIPIWKSRGAVHERALWAGVGTWTNFTFVIEGLRRRGLIRSVRKSQFLNYGPWQITAAGRRAVERSR